MPEDVFSFQVFLILFKKRNEKRKKKKKKFNLEAGLKLGLLHELFGLANSLVRYPIYY